MKRLIDLILLNVLISVAREHLKKLYSGDSSDSDDEDGSASGYASEEEYSVDEEEDMDGDEDHADASDEEAEYLDMLDQKAKQKLEEEDEDEDWSDELNEELYYESPLDHINVYSLFQQTLRGEIIDHERFFYFLWFFVIFLFSRSQTIFVT
jgi:hypothetical protein